MSSFEAKVDKWGNSLAIRIPKQTADEEKLNKGDTVKVELDKQVLLEVDIRDEQAEKTFNEIVAAFPDKTKDEVIQDMFMIAWLDASGMERKEFQQFINEETNPRSKELMQRANDFLKELHKKGLGGKLYIYAMPVFLGETQTIVIKTKNNDTPMHKLPRKLWEKE